MNRSIGRQLFANLSITLAVLWIAVIVMVASVVRYETNEIFDAGLMETAQRILPLAEAHISLDHHRMSFDQMTDDEYVSYQVMSSTKEVFLRSHNAPETAYDLPLTNGIQQRGNQVFFVEANPEKSLFIVVAEKPGHRISTLKDTLIFLSLPLLILVPVTWIVVFWSVSRAQKTIEWLGIELAARTSKDLHPLDTGNLPRELMGLGQSINSLMKRLMHALESERNFAANSAHELRTPIAGAMAQIDVLKADLSGEALYRATEAKRMLKRLEVMTVKLLQLAKAESGVALQLLPVDLVAVTNLLVKELSQGSACPINFEPVTGSVWVLGDLDAIGIVIQNVIENAQKFSPSGSKVDVELSHDGKLCIQNDCEAIPDEKLRFIRQRFGRADESKAGSGIGLAIVETIVTQCRGEMTIKSPCYSNDRGFEITLCFEMANEA